MSHFSTIQINITDKEGLLEALKNLGYETVITTNAIVRGYRGNAQKVDILVPLRGDYDFGFLLEGGVYHLVADWWGVAKAHQAITEQKLVNNLNQQYTLAVTTKELKQKGFTLSHEKLPDGSMRIIAKRMG